MQSLPLFFHHQLWPLPTEHKIKADTQLSYLVQ